MNSDKRALELDLFGNPPKAINPNRGKIKKSLQEQLKSLKAKKKKLIEAREQSKKEKGNTLLLEAIEHAHNDITKNVLHEKSDKERVIEIMESFNNFIRKFNDAGRSKMLNEDYLQIEGVILDARNKLNKYAEQYLKTENK